MKRLILTSCISFITLFTSIYEVSAQSASEQKIKDQIVGIWAYSGSMYNKNDNSSGDDTFKSFPSRTLKIISNDGTYTSVQCSSTGFYASGYGRYEITSDTTYVEQITTNLNISMSGKENIMVIRFSPDANAMSSSFLLEKLATGEEINVVLTEYWERVEMLNPINQSSKLNTKQKVDGVSEDSQKQGNFIKTS